MDGAALLGQLISSSSGRAVLMYPKEHLKDHHWDAPFRGLAELNVVDRTQHSVSDLFCAVFRFWVFF